MNCGGRRMYNFLENARLYLKIQEEMGVIGSNTVHISVDKIKALSSFFNAKVKLHYNDGLDYKYFYSLTVDGVEFVTVSEWEEAWENGLVKYQFKEGAEVWG